MNDTPKHVDDEHERYLMMRDNIFSKFKGARERFNKSPYFNMAIHMLIKGVDPVNIINGLTEIIEELNEELYKAQNNKNPSCTIVAESEEGRRLVNELLTKKNASQL